MVTLSVHTHACELPTVNEVVMKLELNSEFRIAYQNSVLYRDDLMQNCCTCNSIIHDLNSIEIYPRSHSNSAPGVTAVSPQVIDIAI